MSKCDENYVMRIIMCGRKHIWLSVVPACLYLLFARDEERSQSKESHKKVTFNLSGDEGSEGEDMEDIFGRKAPSSAKLESKSSFEKRRDKVIRFIF